MSGGVRGWTMRRMGGLPIVALAAALVFVSGPRALGERVLHEYVPPPDDPDVARAGPNLPDRIRSGGQTIPRPQNDPGPSLSEDVLRGGTGPDRQTQVRLDRTTTHDGVLSYSEVFNPSVVPFKRGQAFDEVLEGYALRVRPGVPTRLPLTPTPTPPDSDSFFGSVLLALEKGKAVPLPSVSPEARIASVQATPQVTLAFHKDSADNFFVTSQRPGKVRLVFLTDAPKSYFSPRIPASAGAASLPPSLIPRLPTKVQEAAQRVLRHLKVDRGEPLRRQIEKLVAYFRSFEPGALPSLTGDTYLDIVFSKRGVCRHRSLAFVITVQALGLPARYVQNEAHAFTEILVPRLGWARIDLGGASSELRVRNAAEKTLHDPGPDPFPRPSRYASSYSQFGGRVTGIRPDERRRVQQGPRLRVLDGSGRGSSEEGAMGRTAREREEAPRRAETSSPSTTSGGQTSTGAPGTPPSPPLPEAPPKHPTLVTVESPTRTVFRGERITVRGRVVSRGSPVGGLPIEIFLSKDGRLGRSIGFAVTDTDGRYRTEHLVPQDIEVGEYKVIVETTGDDRHEGSTSR